MISQYKQEVSKYGKKDGIIALCFFAYIVAAHFFPNAILSVFDIHLTGLSRAVQSFVVFAIPCIALVLIRKQGLSSIGFHRKNLLPALLTGVIFSVLVLVLYGNLVSGISQGWELHNSGTLANIFLATLFFAAWEDIVMMGFVQTRIYGLIKNNVIAVAVGALLFAVMHIPVPFATYGIAIFNITLLLDIVGWMGAFVVWNLVFRRYFSIYPLILLHTFWNFSGRIWYSGGQGLDTTVSFILLVLVISAWAWLSYRHAKKGTKASALK